MCRPFSWFLNRNLQSRYNEALWDTVMQHEFEINDNIDNIISCNTLLHVGVYTQVRTATISSLLNIGVDHYAYFHVNSDGYTPLEFAASFGYDYTRVYDHMLYWFTSHTIAPVINERLQAAFSNAYNTGNPIISQGSDKDGNTKYAITLDLATLLATRGYSLFNDARTVSEEIQAFINGTIQSHNGKVDNDAIIFVTTDTRVIFLSDNEDTLGTLLFGAVNEPEFIER